jgi:hypothetical protein
MTDTQDPAEEPSPDRSWIIETSGDGKRWRRMGTAWTFPGELLLVHAASRLLRYRSAETDTWTGPLERTGSECMALLDLDRGSRRDLFPGAEHLGLPVFLPGGEAGRLLRFEHAPDGYSWTYALEFRGEVPARFRT